MEYIGNLINRRGVVNVLKMVPTGFLVVFVRNMLVTWIIVSRAGVAAINVIMCIKRGHSHPASPIKKVNGLSTMT